MSLLYSLLGGKRGTRKKSPDFSNPGFSVLNFW